MIHHRKNLRLQGYDYSSQGAYFITVVTKDREALFGEILDGEMVLRTLGEIVREEWIKSAEIRKEIEIDEFVVTPNHFHAIVLFFNDQPDSPAWAYGYSSCTGDRPVAPTIRNGPQPRSLGALIAGFKSSVTTHINQIRKTPGMPVWQRNYYTPLAKNARGRKIRATLSEATANMNKSRNILPTIH